ncbi:DegT/DnrJ/EryC1/StrS family aminotransferase [Thermodesulfobacteriota bacterium]
MKKIPVSGPWITQKEIDYVADAAANAWYANANTYYERFEKAFGDYLGVEYAVALPSCTSAIHLSLLALGVGPGDEVIVPDVTWIATAAPITYVGAVPVFADIDPHSWCISTQALRDTITPRTKAVIPVDLYGGVPEWDDILAIAEHAGIAVIEDAAEAIGSEYNSKKAGSFGATGVFSFHGSKTMTTGEGGILVTDDEEIYKRVLFLRDHGRKPGDVMFFNHEVAYKYKMSAMQAAMGLAQIERIEELVERKREIFSWYQEELSGVDCLTLNAQKIGTKNSYWMITVIIDPAAGILKEDLMRKMEAENIATRPFFHPLSSIPAYREHPRAVEAREKNKVSYSISPYGVNLPSGLNLDREKVTVVCNALKTIINH